MTREEAIQVFQDKIDNRPLFKDERDAFDMAIEALQTEGENGEGVVAYVCDNRKCGGDCDNCGRTTDIAHAKNFTRISDSYFERLDSVSVMRCKDCKYCWYDDDAEILECRHCNGLTDAIYGNDFCSYGERQET